MYFFNCTCLTRTHTFMHIHANKIDINTQGWVAQTSIKFKCKLKLTVIDTSSYFKIT